MSEQIEQNLPPGWDCKYDSRTGRYYYVNLFTKTTTWEDPRARFRQLQTGAPLHISNDNISVQPVHGSPYHVYPSSNSFYPAQQAFQNPPSGVPSLTASPNLATKLQQQQQLELAAMMRSSPHTPRMGLGGRTMQQETSFSNNVTAADTDATVAKINSMFPTVPETHIRMLLKKYLKSFFPKAEETLILDVLANADNNVQTASQQLITLGYERREQPLNRGSRKGSDKDGQTAGPSGEGGQRVETQTPTPKPKTPEEKKKIKARLQAKYKDIAERIIMMALESVDYSEDRAKQILNIVIQEDKEKKKSVKIDAPHKPDEDKENAGCQHSGTPSRSNSTSSNRQRTKKVSVDSEGNPTEILVDGTGTNINNNNETGNASIEITTSTTPTSSTAIIKDSPQSLAPPPPPPPAAPETGTGSELTSSSSSDSTAAILATPGIGHSASMATTTTITSASKQSRPRAKGEHAKYSIFRSSSSEDELDGSAATRAATQDKMASASYNNTPRISTRGPNAKLFRGPNDDLLLADYVTWSGANPDLVKGSQKLAHGPDRSIRMERSYKAHGPNGDLCKGPAAGLAKGSMYAAMKDVVVKCN
ncbi:uncharacterized protein LOC120420655 isoform X4 [Culex pipiens pallens]|uniref:uncharacterized protein LOC120420655 isoform X4 n=1 Tax=Culex pipiens pallens TaxID=42434 RepID=UPI001952C874|nr:uncharacterized protein LOC120420655 isoform X4 [Culex pipiens pallens]